MSRPGVYVDDDTEAMDKEDEAPLPGIFSASECETGLFRRPAGGVTCQAAEMMAAEPK